MLNKFLPHIVAFLVFYFIGAVFFTPEWRGDRLRQGDIVQLQGMSGEINDFKEKTGETYYVQYAKDNT